MNFVSSENVNLSTTVLLGIGQLVAIQQLSCHFESGFFLSTVLQVLHCHILIYRIMCVNEWKFYEALPVLYTIETVNEIQ
jgi:hypothetical protein